MHEQVCYQLRNLHTLARGMRIEEKLNEIKGVRAFVNVASGRATVYYNRRWVTEPELRQIIRGAGGKIEEEKQKSLFDARENCVFELCDIAAKPDIPLNDLLCYAASLTAKKPSPFGAEIARVAASNGVEPQRVKRCRRKKQAVSGVIGGHRVRCGTERAIMGESHPNQDGQRLYLSIDAQPAGYLEFSLTRLR